MFSSKIYVRPLGLFVSLMLLAVAPASYSDETGEESSLGKLIAVDVYKTPTCGCCGVWVDHLEERGFDVTVTNMRDLNQIKRENQVPMRYQSCHTAVTEDGYVFEGHIPANIIKRFLDEKPADAIGLTVPAMPVGSPGMENGNMFQPYQVFLLGESGVMGVYAEVRSREEQY